ncbi:MIP/aquaporin family protein [Streptomyces sp. NPDC048106]|uniref:MIP/aquaporin family protein n=1 Tax=Streptomyces sp. NPDC048106 TaxID=3155750 RepID=UPI0034571219
MTEAAVPPSPRATPDRTAAAPAPAVIAGHSALECLLTTLLLFGVTTVVRWVAGPSRLSDAIPGIHLKLLVIGVCVGLLVVAIIRSRPGRISGGHINPAVSLAMWRFGIFPAVAVLPYIAAQLVGSVLGVFAARALWGPAVGDPPVTDAMLRPGPGWSAGELFVAEAVSMGVIVYLIGLFLRSPRLARLVPWLVGFLICAAIALLGTVTGGSENPARPFGPAVVSGQGGFLWVYLLAPMVGSAVAAAVLNGAHSRHTVLTHRLCGTHRDRSPLRG